MENEEKLDEMSIDELASLLIENPEKSDEILAAAYDLLELYEATQVYLIPEGYIYDDNDERANKDVEQALDIINNFVHDDLGYETWRDYVDARDEVTKDKIEIDRFFSRLDDNIASGFTPDELREFCEEQGYDFNIIFDEDILKEKYSYWGYEYNPEDDSILYVGQKEEKNYTELERIKGEKSALERQLQALDLKSKQAKELLAEYHELTG